MSAIVYRNTKTPGVLINTFHHDWPRGLAYDAGTHFVHFYGRGSRLWDVCLECTVAERKDNGTLAEWATRVFGAEDITQARNAAGSIVQGVWRPGLLPEMLPALGNSEVGRRSSEQSLRLLVERLDELLLYVEPNENGLKAYSHKTRELLILACTEIENTWTHYMRMADGRRRRCTTNDYVKLLGPLHLSEFEVSVKLYHSVCSLRPFAGWDAKKPTESLPWYDAYNKTKHDRSSHFDKATLESCFSSIAANVILFGARFSPVPLLEGRGTLAPLINQLFTLELVSFEPESSYIPLLQLPSNMRDDLSPLVLHNGIDAVRRLVTWKEKPFRL
jgi:hypothetical protein